MEENKNNQIADTSPAADPAAVKNDYLFPASIIISAIIIAGAWIYTTGRNALIASGSSETFSDASEKTLSPSGIVLPIRWGDLGIQLTKAGVIDKAQFLSLYASRGGLSKNERRMLESANNESITLTQENAGILLNLFWALGLGNKNQILEKGEMSDPKYNGVGRFASTGGWTIAQGSAMDHFSRHPFIVLTLEQQALVEKVSKNIYRPCCDNSTHFPDCNHGMAMLGLLELMASQNIGEGDMYKIALQMNTYWFPENYVNISQYLATQGIEWSKADPKEILGMKYSSGSGYRAILSRVPVPAQNSGGTGCAVAAPTPKSSGGCGI
ncbi:MAG: hypothetical protein Q8L24_01570 [bacterium]|nr:hypothetical protein [bacterium]